MSECVKIVYYNGHYACIRITYVRYIAVRKWNKSSLNVQQFQTINEGRYCADISNFSSDVNRALSFMLEIVRRKLYPGLDDNLVGLIAGSAV